MKALFATLALALVAVSTTPSSTPSSTGTSTSIAAIATPSIPVTAPELDDCLLGCIAPAAASAGCISFEDFTCTCFSTTYRTLTGDCVKANCTALDVQTISNYVTMKCENITTSSSMTSAASTATNATLGDSPSFSTIGMGNRVELGKQGVIAAAVAVIGAVVGGAMVY